MDICSYGTFETFFGDTPVFICSSDGTVILENAAAQIRFKGRMLGEKLTPVMSAADKLRYEFAIQSKMPRPFVAAANLIFGYHFLAVFIENIGSSAFAVVFAVRSELEAKRLTEQGYSPDISLSASIVKQITDICNPLPLQAEFSPTLFDPDKTIGEIIEKLRCNKNMPVRFRYVPPPEGTASFTSDMGLNSFVHIFTAAAYFFGETGNGTIDIALVFSDELFEIKMETILCLPAFGEGIQDLAAVFPYCRLRLSLIEFMAGCSGCSVRIFAHGKHAMLLLTSGNTHMEPDFKSPESIVDCGSFLGCAVSALESICREEVRA